MVDGLSVKYMQLWDICNARFQHKQKESVDKCRNSSSRLAVSNCVLLLANILAMSLHLQGCHGQGKVRKIIFYSRRGSFVSGQGISKSHFKVSEKPGNFMLDCHKLFYQIFLHTRQKKRQKNYLSHFYVCWFMARIITLYGQWKRLYSQRKVPESLRCFFCSVGGNPVLWIIKLYALTRT